MNVSMFVLNFYLLEMFLHFRKLTVMNLTPYLVDIFVFFGIAFQEDTISASVG